jgi:hypothetical protein
MAADKATLISDLYTAFNAGSNDSTIMSVLIGEAIDKYSKTLTVKSGTLSSTGTGNMGLPVNSQNTNGGVIE